MDKRFLDLDVALNAVEGAIEQAPIFLQASADAHLRMFTEQIRERSGEKDLTLQEPYLEGELLRFELVFLEGVEWLVEDIVTALEGAIRLPRIKSIDRNAPLLLQVEDRLEAERLRASDPQAVAKPGREAPARLRPAALYLAHIRR